MDVAGQLHQIRILFADDGLIPVLKQVARTIMPAVEIHDVTGQQLLHPSEERLPTRAHQQIKWFGISVQPNTTMCPP